MSIDILSLISLSAALQPNSSLNQGSECMNYKYHNTQSWCLCHMSAITGECFPESQIPDAEAQSEVYCKSYWFPSRSGNEQSPGWEVQKHRVEARRLIGWRHATRGALAGSDEDWSGQSLGSGRRIRLLGVWGVIVNTHFSETLIPPQ